jgi:NTE family protein
MMSVEPLRADVVLAGGGVKGIGHVGALAVLEEHGYRFNRIAGTSAGSIVGSLAAADMPAQRMYEVLRSLDFKRFRDKGGIDRVPLAGPALSLLFENGIYEGDAVRTWLASQLESCGVRTFGDLKLDDPDSSLPQDQQYKLVVMVTDIARGELVRLPWDYRDRYGLDPDEQLVADAVRASMSIPYFYEPVKLRSQSGFTSTLVDGGVLSNFPIDVFDRTDGVQPRWPTFGVTLIPKLPMGDAQLFPVLGLLKAGPVHFTEQLLATMIVGHDQGQLAKPWIAARAISVDTSEVGVVDFGLTGADQELLYEHGRAAATEFLAHWDWQAYLDRFRPATPATITAGA